MAASLRISSTLVHDGDESTTFDLIAQNTGFTGTVEVWGHFKQHAELADTLEGFPRAGQTPVRYTFGNDPDFCELLFELIDSLGGVRLTARVSAEELAFSQSAQVAIFVEPAAIDAFVAQLRAFKPGESNVAELRGT